MGPQEFSRRAIRLVGTPVEWKVRLAHLFGVTVTEVEAWAEGRLPMPPQVRERLDLQGERDDPIATNDEWIRGDGLDLTNEPSRAYLVHTRTPRFIARLIEGEEAPAVGRALRIDAASYLNDVAWLDPEPAARGVDELVRAAADALERVPARV